MNRILTFEYDERYSPPFPVIEIEVEGYGDIPSMPVTALVDSGADSTMLPLDILRAVGASYRDSMKLIGVTGGTQIVDRYLIAVKIGAYTVRAIHAVAHENEAIIGRDVLNELSIDAQRPGFYDRNSPGLTI